MGIVSPITWAKKLLLQKGVVRPEAGEDSYEIVSFVHDSGIAAWHLKTHELGQIHKYYIRPSQ